jgi:transposase
MKLYVGLGVGLEETSLCIVDSEGVTVREVKVSTEPEAIRSELEGSADRLDRVGVVASSPGICLYRELQPAGVPIIVAEARHIRVSLSTMRNKTDRNDARGIAQMMRLGWYGAVHVKNIGMQKMRTLLSNRNLLKRKLIDIENHIRGALRAYGLLVGAVVRGAYEARIRELLERSDPIFAMTIEAMLDVRRAIFEGYERLHRVLLQVVQYDPVCRRPMTVPGVGPVAALSFKVGVDDPRRFARSRTVGAHFGLTPRRHQSGTSIDYEGRISKQGDVAVSGGAMRGGCKPSAAGQEMVGIAGVGPADRQTVEHPVRDRRGRAQACKYSASNVGQRNRLPRRLRCQGHATTQIEACAVIAAR